MALVSRVDRGGVTTLTIEHPILARRLLEDLTAALDHLAAVRNPQPLVLASAHPTIFLAGANLAEIAELDASSSGPYAALGRSLASRLASHPAPVVAGVHGSCSGGGVDLVLACDAVVASPKASFSHPGVLRGLVSGWGGTVTLPDAVGDAEARRGLLEGTELDPVRLVASGVIAELADEPVARACDLARSLGRLHPSRLPLWRLLRGSRFVDRFRAAVVEKS